MVGPGPLTLLLNLIVARLLFSPFYKAGYLEDGHVGELVVDGK